MKQSRDYPFAGPWITTKEVEYTVDATINGFYHGMSKYIKKFETAMAEYVGASYVIGTHCCTLALHLACLAIGLKKEDEVICTDLSWIATADAIAYSGAIPVFVDVDFDSWCIDPKAIENAITKKTKAIMIVHMYGHPCQMDQIMAIAKKYNLCVIEDAAPSLGAEFKGRKVGSFGDFGCFSFQGAKIAVSGEGGALLTNDKKLYDRAFFLSTMGRTDRKAKFWCDEIGYQYTIANITAALAVAQVERIEELLWKKRKIFDWYHERLSDISGVKMIVEKKDCKSNYCYPSIYLHDSVKVNRDILLEKLTAKKIFGRPVFPRMSLFPMFKTRFSNPIAAQVSKRGICLPSATTLTEEDIDYICNVFKKFIKA